ncbi:glutathione S-transferase family protein [Sphingomonas sp.]|uniref:glutathione S-transferase family protein n=1 Tax=Sphingomonas sp. TaxID=28214 RepID=UPI0035C79D53
MASHILYGVPHSLYTGKTRAYLRKQGIAYVERTPVDPHFREQVVPRIGRGIIPVVVTPGGELVQDTVDILDHFEAQGVRASARPPGARQRVLAHVAELYAVVGLTRHAMHYRWSYLDEQRAFLTDAFTGGSGPDGAAKVMARMQSYLPMLGVTPETIPAIEASYLALLDLIEAHLVHHPYLFGAQASLGDYGLLGPLFAHLGRDPVPADLMRRRAPRVARWVERMNAPDADMPEYGDHPPGYLADDAVPDTLLPLFRHMAEELIPELRDKAAWLESFVAEADPQEGAPVADKPHQRVIGTVDTSFRGVPFASGVQPYTFFLWQRVTDAADALPRDGQKSLHAWFEKAGLSSLLELPRAIRVERGGYVERWGRRLTSAP